MLMIPMYEAGRAAYWHAAGSQGEQQSVEPEKKDCPKVRGGARGVVVWQAG